MTDTLYFTRSDDLNLLQIKVAASFINKNIATQEINKKYDPLILVTPQGSLNQPIAILHHLVEGQLSGQNKHDQLKVWEWFQHFSLELHPLLRELYGQINGTKEANKDKFQYSAKQFIRELELINNHLKLRTFMIGDSMTIVDISLATHLDLAFQKIINEDTRKKLPNLTRWFNYTRSTGPFLKVLGKPNLCGKDSITIGQKQQENKVESKTEKTNA